jgi:predicted unusual protein kinase regulating ubiquinone biosynthesis (AarF/ABC1/UbiB family)
MTLLGRIQGIGIAVKYYPRARYLRYYQRVVEKTGKPPERQRSVREAIKLRDTMIKSGPLFIKLGQVLSSRRDVVPEEYVQVLTELQDSVPMPPFEPVRTLIEEEIGNIKEVFDEFDETGISGASLGLVYKAKYKGNDVAVKVNRPNIRETIRKDKEKVTAFVALLERFTGKTFSLSAFAEQFLSSLELELDYKREAESIGIIADKISELDLELEVMVPKVYKDISTSKVLVMEYMDFIKITDVDELRSNGANLAKIARIIDEMFLRLALREGRFHADPHPGNLGWNTGNKIVLLDYGMTSELPENMRDKLLTGYYYLSTLDARHLLSVLVDIDLVDPLADKVFMEQVLTTIFRDLEGKEISKMEYQELVHKANTVLFRFPFRLPYNLALFARMSVILDGVCKTLDKDFNFISVVAEIMKEEKAAFKILKRRLLDLPQRIQKVVSDYISLPDLIKNANRPIEVKKRPNYSSAIIASGFLISGAILITSTIYGIILFAGGAIFAALSFRTNL